jgi:hypothetical protein
MACWPEPVFQQNQKASLRAGFFYWCVVFIVDSKVLSGFGFAESVRTSDIPQMIDANVNFEACQARPFACPLMVLGNKG